MWEIPCALKDCKHIAYGSIQIQALKRAEEHHLKHKNPFEIHVPANTFAFYLQTISQKQELKPTGSYPKPDIRNYLAQLTPCKEEMIPKSPEKAHKAVSPKGSRRKPRSHSYVPGPPLRCSYSSKICKSQAGLKHHIRHKHVCITID